MPRVGQYKGLFKLGAVVKWNQSNFYGKTPWIMFGTNPHISIHPSSEYLFKLMAKMVETGTQPSDEELLREMEFDEVHVTISGKHNYFTPDGKWKTNSGGGDESYKGLASQATDFIEHNMFKIEPDAYYQHFGMEMSQIDLGKGIHYLNKKDQV